MIDWKEAARQIKAERDAVVAAAFDGIGLALQTIMESTATAGTVGTVEEILAQTHRRIADAVRKHGPGVNLSDSAPTTEPPQDEETA